MFIAVVAPDEHVVLVFLCQVLALLVVAKSLAALLRRVGQPSVVGELLAGVVLGPSLLGRAWPGGSDWLFPSDATQSAMLFGLAWLGLLLLLAATGFESDLAVIRQLGRPAMLVATGSLVVPLVGGAALGFAAPEALLGPSATTVGFAAFLAVALSISSLPVVATVLTEMGLVRRNVGQLILAVAIANDIIGWILLGVVAGLADADGVAAAELIMTIVAVAVFLVVALTVGQRAVDRLLWTVASDTGSSAPAVAVVALVIAAGALTQWMGVEAVLGAFVAGMVVGRSRWRDERSLRLVESLAHGILAPLFFATAGLRIDLGVFTRPTVAVWSVVIVAVASVTKFAGAVIGARTGGLPKREGLALGAALNARGALEIVIASIGLSLGVLNDASYGAIVVMAIVTSVAAPPLLRTFLAGWDGTPEEQARLAAEQADRSRIVASNRPPLLLTRGRPPSIAAAQVIDLCWPREIPVTVVASAPRQAIAPVLAVLHGRAIRTIDGRPDLAAQVAAEVGKGHGATVIGLADAPNGPLLSPLVETILTSATRPVVLIRSERISGRPLPAAFARAIVPVTGSVNSQAAQELACAMSASIGTALHFVHLDDTPRLLFGTSDVDTIGPLLTRARTDALAAGARPAATIARAVESVPGELLRVAIETEADVVIVGATRRVTDAHVRLGPIVSHLLEACPATVIVAVTPPGWIGARHG